MNDERDEIMCPKCGARMTVSFTDDRGSACSKCKSFVSFRHMSDESWEMLQRRDNPYAVKDG